jgi:chlorosome envelope protein B
MSNGSNIDVAGAVNTLVETAGKLFQLQMDLMNNSLKAITNAAEPLAKTATDLIGNLADAANQVLQNVAAAIAPKK